MPVAMEQVRRILKLIEPDYVEAAMFCEDAMPFTDQPAGGSAPMLAPSVLHLTAKMSCDNVPAMKGKPGWGVGGAGLACLFNASPVRFSSAVCRPR